MLGLCRSRYEARRHFVWDFFSGSLLFANAPAPSHEGQGVPLAERRVAPAEAIAQEVDGPSAFILILANEEHLPIPL